MNDDDLTPVFWEALEDQVAAYEAYLKAWDKAARAHYWVLEVAENDGSQDRMESLNEASQAAQHALNVAGSALAQFEAANDRVGEEQDNMRNNNNDEEEQE